MLRIRYISYIYITSIYILLTKCCASARGVPRHVPPSHAPSHAPRTAHNYELIQAPAPPRTLATSCKTTQGQVGNKRKTFIVLCRKLFPIYVGGCVAVLVCMYVCVCGSLLLLFCVKYCPAQAASAAASHRIMCHTLWPGGHIMRHPICMGCHSLSPPPFSLSLSLESLRPFGHLPHSSALRDAHNT